MILDSLSNGLKDLFAALGAKTSDSNYAVPLLNKTNGTPQGMMDMASLASVLGGITDGYTRKTDFDLADLQAAVADGNLEKYGLKPGDYKTINGHDYVIAGLNIMKGTSSYRLTENHVGLIVIPHTTQAWNVSGNVYQGSDNHGAGYKNSDLHYYLGNTLLPLVNTDLGESHLLGHKKRLTISVDVNATNNRNTSSNPGASNGWQWEENCKICALSEIQVYGSIVWSSSGHDTSEACRQLDVFKKYSFTEIFKDESIWLRDIVSSNRAAIAGNTGCATLDPPSETVNVAALILYK